MYIKYKDYIRNPPVVDKTILVTLKKRLTVRVKGGASFKPLVCTCQLN